MAHGRKHDVRFDRGSVELRLVLDEGLAQFRHSFDNALIKIKKCFGNMISQLHVLGNDSVGEREIPWKIPWNHI